MRHLLPCIACCTYLALVISGLAVPICTAQPPPKGEPPAERVRPESAELKAATTEMREHLKKMREVVVRYNTNRVAEKDREYNRQWIELTQAGEPIHRRMVEAALAEYQSDPANKTAIADMLWRILERNADEDRFEGMLPVAQALMANKYPQEKLLSVAALTAFAVCDFAALKPLVNELVNTGQATPLMQGLQQNMVQLEKAWQAELAAREKDAQGEPLPRVMLHTTKGDIEIELFENQAPETVANFISLIEADFYDGHAFHRVLEHFMAQTGCPTGDGTGGPGYTIYNETDKPGARDFFRGTLGLALAQDPNSGGSQFFISFLPTFQLNDGFTAFGRVVSGIEVLGNLVRIDPDKPKEEDEPKAIPDEIISIEVLGKRSHEYKPNKVPQ